MKLFSGVTLLAAMAACIPMAAATDAPIRIATVIPYESDQVGPENVRKCEWNRELSELIVKRSGGKVEATAEDLATLPGKTLRIAVNKAHTAGGGSISGPKWARITGELREGDVLVGNFSIKRASARPFTLTACSPLSKIADALADDVLGWLQNPSIDPGAGTAPQSEASE